MKKIITFSVLILFLSNINAQNCEFTKAYKSIEVNNMPMIINHIGAFDNHFINKISSPKPTLFCTNGLCIVSKDAFGTSKIAMTLFPNETKNDFSAGPIAYSSPLFNQIWTVSKKEILIFLQSFKNKENPLNIPLSLQKWPAKGNIYYKNDPVVFSFLTKSNAAPFFDTNKDGLYNPYDGDFPLPSACSNTAIPDEIHWLVFNDDCVHTQSKGQPIKVEVQQTTWAFHCTESETLENTVFNSYNIKNKSDTNLDSVYVGLYSWSTIGCPLDDYAGCSPQKSTYFFYNSDNIDGNISSNNGCSDANSVVWKQNPPATSVTFLNQKLYSFFRTDSKNTSFFQNKYEFSGNPNNPNEWSMKKAYKDSLKTSIAFGGVMLSNLKSEEQITVDVAFSKHHRPMFDNLQNVNLMYLHTDTLQNQYNQKFTLNCTNTTVNSQDFEEKSNLFFYPNPFENVFILKNNYIQDIDFQLLSINNSIIARGKILDQEEKTFSTNNLPQGIYFLRYSINGKFRSEKIIKLGK